MGLRRRRNVRKPRTVAAGKEPPLRESDSQAARKPPVRQRLRSYLLRHVQVLIASLGRLYRTPLSSLMTVAVIGIAIALPAGLHVILGNVATLSGQWEGQARISLFMLDDVTATETQALAEELRADNRIQAVQVISPEQALDEFRELSGFGAVLQSLEENPLPGVIVVEPAEVHASPAALEQLLEQLKTRDGVDIAQLDMQWVKRLAAMMKMAQRGTWVVGSLLALAVLLIIGNTIRLDIQGRRPEIEVMKLVGATDAFVRRPFLYTGLWYGLLGGIIAMLLVGTGLWLLHGPATQLASAYNSSFLPAGIELSAIATMIAIATALGLAGSWLSVSRHLNAIQPS